MSIRADEAVIIEVAINGANQSAPRLPEEIAACAASCFDLGAAIVHNHIDFFGAADAAAARYLEGWQPVVAARPDALLYPTINGIGAVEGPEFGTSGSTATVVSLARKMSWR